MDFFREQDLARKRSGRLVLMFIAAVIAIMISVYVVAMIGFNAAQKGLEEVVYWDSRIALAVGGGLTLVIVLGSLFRISTLASGGPAVANMVGGRLVSPNTSDADERRLLNIVEEMALASGTSVPPVYIMEESGINAFAAGYKIDNAVIGVTRGAMERLDRDELQGVVAHEFSHILHGDMKLNIRLMGVLYGILMISVLGSILMRTLYFSGGRRSSSRDNNQGVMLAIGLGGLAMYIIGYVGIFFGNLIKAAVSRQREYLADASAVQYTRNPDGIAGALKKIGGYHTKIENPHATEASHFFFGPISNFSDLLSTHPPLQDRIGRIQPYFDQLEASGKSAYGSATEGASGLSGFASGNTAGPAVQASQRQAQDQKRVMSSIGDPQASHMAYGHHLVESLPHDLREAIRDPFDARAIVFGLLLDDDQQQAAQQLTLLERHADVLAWQNFLRLRQFIQDLPEQHHIELVSLAIPALSQMAQGQRVEFLQRVDELIEADDHITTYEYALRHILHRALDVHWQKSPGRPSTKDLQQLLMTVSAIGAPTDDAAAGAAYVEAIKMCGKSALAADFNRGQTADWTALDLALRRLAEAKPKVKRALLAAALGAVAHDGEVTPAEGDVVRALALALECPIPPLVTAVHSDAA